MSVAFDAAGAPTTAPSPTGSLASGADVPPFSWAHTVGIGSNRVLWVALAVGCTHTGADFTRTVTYNGASMSQVALIQSASSSSALGWIALYRLDNPDSGTHNITVALHVNVALTIVSIGAASASYSNVGSVGAAVTNAYNGTATMPNQSVTLASGGVALTAITCSSAIAVTGTGATTRGSAVVAASSAADAIALADNATSGTFGATGQSSSDTWGAITVAMAPAAAPLALTDPGAKSGQAGTALTSFTLAASGGTAPYSYSATGLPAGVTCTSSGTVSGAPTTAGAYTATYTATDAASATSSAADAFTIAAAPTADPWAKWRGTAVPGMQAKNRLAKILTIGDSILEGQGATAKANRIVDQLLTRIRSRYSLSAGGAGYIPAWYAVHTVSTPWAAPATTTGTQSSLEQGARSITLAAGQYVEWAGLVGTDVDVLVRDATSGGDLLASVDGGAGTTLDCNSVSGVSKVHPLTLGAHGTHTLRLTATGGQVVVGGPVVYDGDKAAGVTMWDCTHTGYASGNFGTDQSNGWANFAPDLVIYDLFNNDFLLTSTAPATTAARFASFIGSIPGTPTVVLLIPYDVPSLQGTNGGGYTFQQYIDAMTAQAASLNAVVFNLRNYYPSVPTSYIASDGVHPSDAGHVEFAHALDQFLAGVTVTPTSTGSGAGGGTTSPPSSVNYDVTTIREATRRITIKESA